MRKSVRRRSNGQMFENQHKRRCCPCLWPALDPYMNETLGDIWYSRQCSRLSKTFMDQASQSFLATGVVCTSNGPMCYVTHCPAQPYLILHDHGYIPDHNHPNLFFPTLLSHSLSLSTKPINKLWHSKFLLPQALVRSARRPRRSDGFCSFLCWSFSFTCRSSIMSGLRSP